MTFTFFSVAAPTALFAGSLVLQEVGRSLGRRHVARNKSSVAGLNAVEGAVFALMGLLLAFTLSGALQRLDYRKQLIVDEANAIRTVSQRIDLLPPAFQPVLRNQLRNYVAARLALYEDLPDFSNLTEAFSHPRLVGIRRLQRLLWMDAVAACTMHTLPAACTLLLPALNTMFDVSEVRVTVGQRHPPNAIFIMLVGIALASSVLAGFGMGNGEGRSWLHSLGFAAAVAITLFIITNLEFPRLGIIRIDDFDQVLRDVQSTL